MEKGVRADEDTGKNSSHSVRDRFAVVGFSSYGAFSETGNMEKEAAANGADAFNFETRTVMLNSGHEMPIYGLGTYSLHDDVCRNSVTAALNRGVRLIDTAHALWE